MTQYMVIETFLPGCKEKVYERFHERGRMLPEGLTYLNSWPEKDGARCFQLMEANDLSLFKAWTDRWKDLVSFEIVEISKRQGDAQGSPKRLRMSIPPRKEGQ